MSKYRSILNNIPPAPILCYDVTNINSYPGSGTLVTDIVKNSNATLINGPLYSAFTSGSLYFDGTNDYLMTSTGLSSKFAGSSPNKSEITSIFMWVYPMDNGVILTEQGNTSLNSGWHDSQIEMVSGSLKFGMWNGAGQTSVTSSVATPLNNWYYVGMTYNGSTLTAYVDGVNVGSVTFNREAPYNNGSNLHYAIAAQDPTSMGDGSYAKMYLGRFEVYNYVLTQSQIRYNYNNTKQVYLPIPSDPLVLLDGSSYTSGSVWYDSSKNNNNATLFNTPTYTTNNYGYFTFNGVDEYAGLPSGFDDFTNGITVLSFVDFGSASSWERIIDFGQGQGDDNIILARESTTNTLTFELYNGSSISLSVDLTNGVINNGWGFYGFKADGSTYKLFNHITSISGSSSALPSNVIRTNNYVGRSNWSVDNYFERYIGVVSIYDRSLSDSEITQFYNSYKNRYGL